MKKIFLTADIHGDYKPIRNFIKNNYLNENDILILLGDSGFNFFFNYRDEKLKEKINKYNITIFTIRGNHEERPSLCMMRQLQDWHMEEFWGNQVYVENKYPNIKYALDTPAEYEIPTAQGESIKTLVLPGAYSVDKYYRLANGWSWFPQEQCTEEEMAAAAALIQNRDWDLVLSHTCPLSFEPTDLFLSVVDQSMVDKSTERWLNQIEHNINYKLWAFGHYHQLRIYPEYDKKQMIMLFNDAVLDVYKYFCGKYPINKCILKIDKEIIIDDLR